MEGYKVVSDYCSGWKPAELKCNHLLTESKAIVIIWFNSLVQNLLRSPFKLKFVPLKRK